MLQGLLFLFLSQVFGAFLPTSIKIGVETISPFTFTFLRFLLATIFFVPSFFIFSTNKKHLGLKNFPQAIFLGICFFGNVGLYSIAIQFTTVIMAQIIYVATPLIVGFLGYIFLRERFSKQQIIGLIIAIIGVIFLIIESQMQHQIKTFGTLHGNLLMILAVIGYSSFIVYSKKLSKNFSWISISFASFYATMLLLFPFMCFELLFHHAFKQQISITSGVSLFVAAFFGSVLSYTLFQVAITKTTAFIASMFQYISPLLSGIVAIVFLGEKPTITLFFGGLLIISGVFIATTLPYLKRIFLQ